MFEAAKEESRMWTWIKRLIGFFMMFIGLSMILKPLSTVMDVIPILGSITSGITGVFAFIIALGLSLITIAIAWVFFRPMIGIPLLLVGLAALIVPRFLAKKKAAQ